MLRLEFQQQMVKTSHVLGDVHSSFLCLMGEGDIHQFCYILADVPGFGIGQEALMDLGLVSRGFPHKVEGRECVDSFDEDGV